MRKRELRNLHLEDVDMGYEDLLEILEAVMQVYPMIVFANLSKNTYSMLSNQEFLYNEVAESGCYDDLIEGNIGNVHSNYQGVFRECFARERLMNNFSMGRKEVYAEIYQKDRQGEYRWVSAHVIRLADKTGEIHHVCFNRPLYGAV
jgi:fibrillarin-like rRNA methylase